MFLADVLVSMGLVALVLTLCIFMISGTVRFVLRKTRIRKLPLKTYPQFEVRNTRSKRNKMIWLVVFFLLWGTLLWLYTLVVQGIQF